MAQEVGRVMKKPERRTHRATISFKPSILKRLEAMCKKHGMTKSEVVEQLIATQKEG